MNETDVDVDLNRAKSKFAVQCETAGLTCKFSDKGLYAIASLKGRPVRFRTYASLVNRGRADNG